MDAKERLSSSKETVKYATFDIGQNLENQELKDHKFDVIVAFHITGMSEHLDVALSNAKKLLKGGGQLCLVEITNPGIRLSMLGHLADSR